MASQQPGNLPAMFSELNKFINVGDHKQALKTANKILHTKEGNSDMEAMQCKVVCFLQMSQFSEALKYIESTAAIKDVLVFEKAYCQYRLLETQQSLDTINTTKDHDLRLLELKAQVLYKLGLYKEALSIYKRLMKECSDDFEEERMTNLSAVYAALAAFNHVDVEVEFKAESYEQLYNRACWLLGRGKLTEAQDTLEEAITSCKELYADDPDMTPEEIEAELSVIRVQLAYAFQLQGKDNDALVIYNQVLRSRPSDVALIAVVSNNIITINKEQNVFDSRKKIKATVASGVENKLVPYQKRKIDFNRALLFMYSNQWEPCRKLLKSLHREHPTSEIPCLIQAAQLCREKNTARAIEYLQGFIEEKSDPDIDCEIDLTNIKLALVQLLLSKGEISKSCTLLESLSEICYTPAMVSCLVSLYNAQANAADSAGKLMNRAIEWHKKNKSPNETLINLMWESSQWSLKHNNPQQASQTLEAILRLDPKNIKVIAQLIFAYSQFNASKAHQISEDLPSLEELSVHVDVDELERNAGRLAPRYVKKQKEKKEPTSAPAAKKGVVSEGSGQVELKKSKKKKKKNPAPKDFQPGFTPDPERWIPIRERSYYKGRRKDRKKGLGKGTQGSKSASAESYDMSQKSATSASFQTPNSPKAGSSSSHGNTPVNSPKPSQTRTGPKGKKPISKKKKKGKGW